MKDRIYISIDLKSFYASVECMERGLDPNNTNLVVADAGRTQKTICLAVSPSLKAYGISGRARLFQVVQKVKEMNKNRKVRAGISQFQASSFDAVQLKEHEDMEITYVTAQPRMALYMRYSTKIYGIYLKYIAPEDMHVYSIDEVFMDVTEYLNTYGVTPEELAMRMIKDVLNETGITATAGIGTNLYLCKIAMDVEAKHIRPDANGVRIARLDEISYRKSLWSHKPITDFWRVGKGYATKLAEHGMYTMGDVARCSLGDAGSYHNEELLYKLFGVNAQLLIDHAWGYEPVTIADIKTYKPKSNSIGSGQVLECPYEYDKTRLVVREMADALALDLVDKGLVTDQLVLTIGYDIDNLTRNDISYKGAVTIDAYGRRIPKHAHGTENIKKYTSSSKKITDAVMKLYDRIIDPKLLARRIQLTANHVIYENEVIEECEFEQLDLFTDYEELTRKKEAEKEALEREKKMQKAMLDIKKKYGKNSILKGMNLEEGATAIKRNGQVGGHKA